MKRKIETTKERRPWTGVKRSLSDRVWNLLLGVSNELLEVRLSHLID